ncbi:hypothetical protein N8T08_005528 [Aspergillus melleus]|uniref:Uncharacterized protein n=1 Tax=Aspergillus melleus TaxID=138277 RepID=A0ACC3B2K5_9EURO|nr:hypothetical protein N8T08_005528 [Aspergillus melleus]
MAPVKNNKGKASVTDGPAARVAQVAGTQTCYQPRPSSVICIRAKATGSFCNGADNQTDQPIWKLLVQLRRKHRQLSLKTNLQDKGLS